MVSELELRRELAAVLNGDVSLDDFEDWFTVASWNAHKDSSPVAQKLVGAIELRLGEYSNGHLSVVELHRELEGLLRAEPVQVSFSINTNIPVSVYLNISPSQASSTSSVVTGATRARRRFVPVLLSA